MNAALVLLLCGLSSALAFDCHQDYPKECITGKDVHFDFKSTFPETAADLDDFCGIVLKELDCNIAFSKECPKTLTAAFLEATEDQRSFLGKVCEQGNPLRQKYLEKADCLNKESDSADSYCKETVKERDWCKNAFEVTKCAEEELVDKCGEDGRNMISELFKTRFASNDVFCRTE